MAKKTSDAQIKASNKYTKEHNKGYLIRFNIDTEKDIIEYINSLPNKQGYIKGLIKTDLQGKDIPGVTQDGDIYTITLERSEYTMLSMYLLMEKSNREVYRSSLNEPIKDASAELIEHNKQNLQWWNKLEKLVNTILNNKE